jgi:cobalt/nickel transport system permease protein
VLSAAFFVTSLIHVPLGPTSAHLTLSGLMGLVLGWAAFPALLIALLLQAVFVSFGGLTTLGLNTVLMALPGVACYYFLRPFVQRGNEATAGAAGFAAGAIAILLGSLLNATSLWAAGGQFEWFGHAVLAAHLPVAAIEGLVTAQVVVLLKLVRPELLEAPLLSNSRVEVSHG